MSPSPHWLTISVIVPVHHGGEKFHDCLSSIAKAAPPPEELIVVADGNGDGSCHMAEEFGAKVLRLPTSQGPACARNLGGHEAQSDILFFVDADVMIPPDAISKVRTAFAQEPLRAALFGSYDDEPGEKNFLSQYKNLFHYYIHQISKEEASTFWGACGAIRREVFLRMGGFNEQFRLPSVEDIELGYRLKQKGYRIQLCKHLQVKHLKHWTITSLLKSDFLHRALPWTGLILRDRHFINDLNLHFSSRISVILVYNLWVALAGVSLWRGFPLIGIGFCVLLLVVNAPLYFFFRRKRGLWFMVRAVLWHWFYYSYCGLAFAIGLGQFLFRRMKFPEPSFP